MNEEQMKIVIDEGAFLEVFGNRQSSEFQVYWMLSKNRSTWIDLTTGEAYVVSYSSL